MVARPGGLSRHEGMAVRVHTRAHEQVEGIMHVIRRQAVFALRLGLDVMAIGVHGKAVGSLVDVGTAARKQHVVAADGVFENVEHRALARRRRPHEGAGGRMKAVHRAGAAAMHELLVVVQVEAIEIGALAAFDLLDAQDLVFQQLDRLAGAGLDDEFGNDRPGCHRAASAPASAFRAAAYSRSASRTSETRSGATPWAMVRSISSSCCWFNRNLTMVSAIKASFREQPFWQNLVYRIWRADRHFLDFSHRLEAPEDASKQMQWLRHGRLSAVSKVIRSAKFGRPAADN